MKIKVPPRRGYVQQPQTIIVKERGEGCFLQTLNIGCAIVFLVVAAIVAFAVFIWYEAQPETQASRATPAPSPVAAPVASPKNEPAKPTAVPVVTPQASPVVAPATPPPTPPKSPLARWEVFKKVDEMTDATTYLFALDGERVDMSPKEYDLFFYMLANRNIAISREKFISEVWGYDFYGDVRTLDTHIKLLRKSLGRYANLIVTLRGVGYRFEG